MLFYPTLRLAGLYISCLVFLSLSINCQAGRDWQEDKVVAGPVSDNLHLLSGPSTSPGIPIANDNVSIARKPKPDQILDKRRNPIRPITTKTTISPAPTETITFFNFDWIYTQDELRYWVRKIPEAFAALIVGLELEPRHDLHLRLGAFSLNLYAVAELLTQTIVLAVLNRLTYLFTRGFLSIGLGEVTVGAGVKVVFAAGIRLQGLEDVQREIWQRLLDYVG